MISSSRTLSAAVLTVALGATAVACGNDSADAPGDGTNATVPASENEPAEETERSEMPTTEDPTTTETAPPVEQPAEGDISEEFIGDTLSTNSSALEDPSVPTDLANVLDGAALEEAEALRVEYNNSGLRQEGQPEVLSAREVENDGETKVMEVCVDNSNVRTLDENGNQVNPELSGEEARAKMLLTFTDVDGTWKLSNTSFPNDPSC